MTGAGVGLGEIVGPSRVGLGVGLVRGRLVGFGVWLGLGALVGLDGLVGRVGREGDGLEGDDGGEGGGKGKGGGMAKAGLGGPAYAERRQPPKR